MSGRRIQIANTVNKIPENIWVETVKLVNQYNAVNLGQGFPDFAQVVPAFLKKALQETQNQDASVNYNQYTRGQGHVPLVKAIADIYTPMYYRKIDPIKEILVTVGGYEALHCILSSVVNPGDEVILIEPYFDSYRETIRQLGGVPKYITLKLKEGGRSSCDFYFDKEELASMFNEKTKAIVINTPHNPTGKVFTKEEIEFVGELCKKHNTLYVSDEVYEWLVYPNSKHVRAASLPGMWDITATVCSAGKTFNVTGWKTGWLIAPDYLTDAAMKVHQGIIYTCPTPLQEALARMFVHEKKFLGSEASYFSWLVKEMTLKRERTFKMLQEAGLNPIMPDGGYFMVADVSQLDVEGGNSEKPFDQIVQKWLIKKGIAVIPCSVFCSPETQKTFQNFIRICFIKGEDTFTAAEDKFKMLKL